MTIFSRIIVFILILVINNFSSAQDFNKNSFYGGLFHMSNYISSDRFVNNIANDLDRADSLFIEALNYYDGDRSEALLCLTFACLPFNKIEFKLPFGFGIVNVPLPSPSKNIFDKRTRNMPRTLFYDSPQTLFGDKDKLSHFFGNAFLRYNITFFNLSKFMGIFVELTEDNFFANGSYDERDLIVNHLGEYFAESLRINPESKPSNALKIYQLLFFRVSR
jgi:hypothetical protein